MDFTQLYQSTEKELQSLKQQHAVKHSQILELCNKLNLDPSSENLSEIVEGKITELKGKLSEFEAQIEELQKQLKELL